MSNIKVLIVEKDGVELAEATEHQLTTSDIPEGDGKYFTDSRVAASPQVAANTAAIAANTTAIATKAADSVVVKSVNGKTPTSGSVVIGASDIAFDKTGTQYQATTVQAALLEAKEILIVTADPSVSPGLSAALGTLAYKKTTPVGFWQKKGSTDTDWAGVAYGKFGGSGVTPPFFFSRSGATIMPGTYLLVGNVTSSSSGQPIAGNNYINKISVTNSNLIEGNPAVFQLQRRTGVNAFVDITGATVSIPVGGYTAITTGLEIAIGPDAEISAYFKSGGPTTGSGNPGNVVLGVYLTPQT